VAILPDATATLYANAAKANPVVSIMSTYQPGNVDVGITADCAGGVEVDGYGCDDVHAIAFAEEHGECSPEDGHTSHPVRQGTFEYSFIIRNRPLGCRTVLDSHCVSIL
jgi:hypothetical protein